MDFQRRFDPVPYTVRDARRFVCMTVVDWELDPGDAELLVSELATNAVLHARTPYEVAVSPVDAGGFRVAVSDDDPTPPLADLLGTEDGLGGRGVALVAHLSKRWGCDRNGTGKTVWFEL